MNSCGTPAGPLCTSSRILLAEMLDILSTHDDTYSMSQTTDFENQIIETLEAVQEFVIDTSKSIAETVASFVPDLSALPLDTLPDPAEIVDRSFAFSEKLLAANKSYVSELLNAWAPVTEAARGGKETAKAGPKAASTKAA